MLKTKIYAPLEKSWLRDCKSRINKVVELSLTSPPSSLRCIGVGVTSYGAPGHVPPSTSALNFSCSL